MSLATTIVRISARVLPSRIRDQYREQWLADVRDAPEAGLRPSQIALASLAFAATFDRPLPVRRIPTDEQRAQRSRLALGLALSAALLSLSVYPGISFQGLTDLVIWDYTRFFVGMLLLAYGALAPLVALIIVRGARQRWAVTLLSLACTAPILVGVVNGALPWQWSANIYVTPGGLAFLGAAVLIVIACALSWTPSAVRIVRAPVIGALAVPLVAGLGLVYGNSIAWSEDLPVAVEAADPAMWAEWRVLVAQHQATVAATFVGWAIVAAVVGVLVLLIGRRMSERGAIALGVAAVAVSLLGASGVFGLLELGISDSVLPVLLDPLRLVAQVALVAVTLVSVGGIRYLPRVRTATQGASST